MSAIRTGSRLEELKRLHARIAHEIAVEEARERDRTAGMLPPIARRAFTKKKPIPAQEHLERLGVTARTVKEWAVSQGLLDAVKRGRVSAELVAAYAQATRTQS